MAKISKQDIDYIFENIDIVSLVSEYIKLEKRGQNYLGLCPFHNEKTPSFFIYTFCNTIFYYSITLLILYIQNPLPR